MKYNKYRPNEVHMVNGQPVIYNKADKPIHFYDAMHGFKAAFNTMWTHAARAFRLAEAAPTRIDDPDFGDWSPRELELERFDWQLQEVEGMCRMMRSQLEDVLDKEGIREKIAKLRAKAESTTFPGEARVFHDKADEIERKNT